MILMYDINNININDSNNVIVILMKILIMCIINV